MGEYAEECIQLGINQMDSNIRKHGVPFPGTKMDPSYWEDINGTLRRITDMDSMHICFVLKQIEIMNGNKRIKTSFNIKQEWLREKYYNLTKVLHERKFTAEDFAFNIEGVKLGLYCMYPHEDSRDLEAYYANLFAEYDTIYPPQYLQNQKEN